MFVLRSSCTALEIAATLLAHGPARAPEKPSAFSFSIARFLAWAQGGLHAIARHTGLPIVLIAAVALVVSWSFVRKSARFLVEVGLVIALLLIATGLGWISW